MNKINYEQMVPQKLICEKKKNSIVYLPIGPLEWHGPHMGMGVDAINAYGVSKIVAERIGGVVLPPLYMGTEKQRSPECLQKLGFEGTEKIVGMDFPKNSLKSLYWPEILFEEVISQYIKMLINADYRLIVLMNGHGADNQIEILNRLAKKFTETTSSTVLYVFTLSEGCGAEIGHAGLAETSITQYLRPEGVDLSQLPDRAVELKNTEYAIVDNETFVNGPNENFTVRYDPRDSTSELGKHIVCHTADYVCEKVSKTYSQMSCDTI